MPKRSYTFLDHTADVVAACRADTFEGLLEAAARALYDVALDDVRSATGEERSVEIQGDTREDLLVRWLNELIFLLDVEHFVATDFTFVRGDLGILSAHMTGYICEPEERATEVKAATYHGMHVADEDGRLSAEVVFDL